MKSILKLIRSAFLFGVLLSLSFVLTARLEAPALPALAVAKTPDDLIWWNEQADAAGLAGFSEAEAEYKTRAEAFIKNHAAPANLSVPIEPIPHMKTELYIKQDREKRPSLPLAKHEPISGVYLGMLGADRRVGYDITKIDFVYGRKHAIFLSYVGWRKVQTTTDTYFPKQNAERAKALGGALQIGWEPRYGLDDVKDDEYVRRFAREAKESGIPIFLRYASEMNGAWVPWHGDPQKYIEKFRLIHKIMAEEAPNVAMVWSPNFWPPDTIHDYYPGDEYVDWVGFSLYATPLSSGKEDLRGNIIDSFTPLYERYKHKPIMISEAAVAHTVLPSNKSYPDWAEAQIGYLYGVLPRIYPQVKAITYFNYSRAQAVRTNMQYVYDLGENTFTDALYKRLVRSEWFLPGIETGADPVPYTYEPVRSGQFLPGGKRTFLMFSKLEDGSRPFALGLFQGGRKLGIAFEPPWEVEVDLLPQNASEPLQVVAYNRNMEVIGSSNIPVK
jgi:hypothetical protein